MFIAILGLLGAAVIAAAVITLVAILLRAIQRLKEQVWTLENEIEFLEDAARESKNTRLVQTLNIHRRLVRSEEARKKLSDELKDAYKSLDLLLGEQRSPFDNVAVEIGLNGVTYQFHQLEKENIS